MSFKFPDVRVTRVNVKNLIPDGGMQLVDTHQVLKRLQREVLKQIKSHIFQETFTHRAKRAMAEGMEVVVGPRSITVVAKHPAFRPLLEGQRARQMLWLTKAVRPIPIVLDTGELIFRNATPRSMENGSWYHPGRKPTTVLDRAKKAARTIVKKKVREHLRRQFRDAIVRASRK